MMLAAQVVAIRASAAAIVAQCDALLTAVAAVTSVPPQDGVCQHPPGRRLAVARMGAPLAWRCECGAEGGE